MPPQFLCNSLVSKYYWPFVIYKFMLLDGLSFYRLTKSLLIVHANYTLSGAIHQEIICLCVLHMCLAGAF